MAWGKKAELIERYVKKGQLVAIEGRLINRVLTDLNGKKSKLTQIQVDEILLINAQMKTPAWGWSPTPLLFVSWRGGVNYEYQVEMMTSKK